MSDAATTRKGLPRGVTPKRALRVEAALERLAQDNARRVLCVHWDCPLMIHPENMARHVDIVHGDEPFFRDSPDAETEAISAE